MEAAQLKQEGHVKKVVVTGCLAQRYADELAGESAHPCHTGCFLSCRPSICDSDARCVQRAFQKQILW